MRSLEIATLMIGLPLVAACGDPECEHGEGSGDAAVYTLELADDSPSDTSYPMTLTNDTLVFPLALGEGTRSLTPSSPGDLVIAYTRVGCWIDDPGPPLADHSPRAVPPVHLTRITMDQVSPGAQTNGAARSLSEQTCFTYRSCDGEWHPLLAPTTITAEAATSTAAISLDVEGVDAVAIFLPSSTHATKITYTAE